MRITLYYPEPQGSRNALYPHELRYAAGFEFERDQARFLSLDDEIKDRLQDFVDQRGLAVGKYIVQATHPDRSAALFLYEVASANPPLQVL